MRRPARAGTNVARDTLRATLIARSPPHNRTTLVRALSRNLERRSVALVLVGEPGIGKTRLLAELAARADERGQLVLYGSASELERELPFWVFVDALDEYVQGLEPRRLEALDDDVRTELAQVLPSLSRFAAARGAAFQ